MTKHIVGFSGGIDSQACARWVMNRHPPEDVILLNSDPGGNEHPLTTEWINNYSEKVHPVVTVKPLVKDLWETENYSETKGLDGNAILTFGDLIKIRGRSPSPTRQFCTTYLKLHPARRWIFLNVTDDYIRYSGVRRDESPGRRDAPETQWDEFFDCELRQPLFDWTKMMCFDYVKAHGESVNPLYMLGFSRVGCAPCINANKEDIRNWSDRFPEMIDKVRAWEKLGGRTFFRPMVPGCTINDIDTVVEWAHTAHGGRQLLLPIMHAPEPCQSKYGLCE